MIDSSLPLTDIHRHLDGNIRAQTILDLGREFNIALPATTLDTLRPHVQSPALSPIWLVSSPSSTGVKVPPRWKPVAAWRMRTSKTRREMACTTLSCASLPLYGDDPPAAGRRRGRGGNCRGSRGMPRFPCRRPADRYSEPQLGEAACQEELAALLAHREGITALDLAGDELGFPGTLFRNHFNQPATLVAYHRPRGRSGRPGKYLAGHT